jgi:hypothetical protein
MARIVADILIRTAVMLIHRRSPAAYGNLMPIKSLGGSMAKIRRMYVSEEK